MRQLVIVGFFGSLFSCASAPLFAAPTEPAASSSQILIPETPAGKAFGMWYGAMNSRDPVQIQTYIDRYKRSSSAEDYIGFYEQIGFMNLVRFEENASNIISGFVTVSNSDDLYRVRFVIDENDPTNVVDIDFSIIERPADLAIPRLSEEAVLAGLDKLAEGLVADDKFAGAMLISKKGQPIYSKAWGLADLANNIPNSVNTKFRLGSANKMFTAVAVLQLVDKCKLSLDGTVGQYLPDYPNKELADKVTIRHMLTHTGGTGEIFTSEYMANIPDYKTHADYVNKFGTRPPEFEPGSQERYSNYGFLLLGYIVEQISGMSYYDYVEANIFAPAGMADSGFLPENVKVEGRSTGYTRTEGGLSPNDDTLPYRGTGAGGGYSTVIDMARFAAALTGGSLLPPSLLNQATTSQAKGGWYGFGFQIRGTNEMLNFGHSGGAPGMNADFRIYPRSETVIVALSNRDGPYTETLTGYYAMRMPIETSPLTPTK